MRLLARLTSYLAPLSHGPSVREHRQANRAYAAQLIEAERDYWYASLRRALTDEDRRKARHELDHLDTLQEQARG